MPEPLATRQNYIRVPSPDYLAEGYRRAVAAEAKANDHYKPLAERLERMAHHIADSLRTADRMSGEGRQPSDIVIQRG